MKSWAVKNAKLIAVVALTLVIGLCSGFLLRDVTRRETSGNGGMQVEPVGQMGKASILPDTDVLITYTFLLCGHTREMNVKGGEFSGCTLEDITRSYADARVMELNAKKAIIQRELERYCPAHYMLYLDAADTLCISNTSEEDYTVDELQVLELDAGALAQEVIAELEEGIVLDNLEQINAYFEGVEES
ncbi:MAG: hypothetical protein LBS18_05855 [Clostridiales bacterium]|jgi:hypothetical protein|nr:hypothetical protein [Clostridiales bacterium]